MIPYLSTCQGLWFQKQIVRIQIIRFKQIQVETIHDMALVVQDRLVTYYSAEPPFCILLNINITIYRYTPNVVLNPIQSNLY